MVKSWSTEGAVVLGASLVALTCVGGAAMAYADPDLGPLINTTCSYSQVVAALNAQAPDLAKELAQFPTAQSRLQKFLAAPVDQRQQMLQQAITAHPQWESTLDQKVGAAQGQQDENAVLEVANTCSHY